MKPILSMCLASALLMALAACNDEKKPANDQTTVQVLERPDGGPAPAATQAMPEGGW